MATTIAQQTGTSVNSTSSGPTSLVFSPGSSQVDSLLLAFVSCFATLTPSITPPAGWSLVAGSTATIGSNGILSAFVYPNNPGGLTTHTFTVSASSGCAAGTFAEYTGLGPLQTVDASAQNSNGNFQGPQPLNWSVPAAEVNTLYALCNVFDATHSFSSLIGGDGNWNLVTSATTTGSGTNNITARLMTNISQNMDGNAAVGGKMNAAGLYMQSAIHVAGGTRVPILQNSLGYVVPPFYQGTIGGG